MPQYRCLTLILELLYYIIYYIITLELLYRKKCISVRVSFTFRAFKQDYSISINQFFKRNGYNNDMKVWRRKVLSLSVRVSRSLKHQKNIGDQLTTNWPRNWSLKKWHMCSQPKCSIFVCTIVDDTPNMINSDTISSTAIPDFISKIC